MRHHTRGFDFEKMSRVLVEAYKYNFEHWKSSEIDLSGIRKSRVGVTLHHMNNSSGDKCNVITKVIPDSEASRIGLDEGCVIRQAFPNNALPDKFTVWRPMSIAEQVEGTNV